MLERSPEERPATAVPRPQAIGAREERRELGRGRGFEGTAARAPPSEQLAQGGPQAPGGPRCPEKRHGQGHEARAPADESARHFGEPSHQGGARAGGEERAKLGEAAAQPAPERLQPPAIDAAVGRLVLARRRGIGLDPTAPRDEGLHPGVGVGLAHRVVAADAIGLSNRETPHVARGDALAGGAGPRWRSRSTRSSPSSSRTGTRPRAASCEIAPASASSGIRSEGRPRCGRGGPGETGRPRRAAFPRVLRAADRGRRAGPTIPARPPPSPAWAQATSPRAPG